MQDGRNENKTRVEEAKKEVAVLGVLAGCALRPMSRCPYATWLAVLSVLPFLTFLHSDSFTALRQPKIGRAHV